LSKNKDVITADNQFNWTGGLIAGFLMEAEMNGNSGVSFKAILD
jgi:hypothetical protein